MTLRHSAFESILWAEFSHTEQRKLILLSDHTNLCKLNEVLES